MSLNKTFIDKAEVTWQFKANDQEKVSVGKIDIFSQFGYSRKRLLWQREKIEYHLLSFYSQKSREDNKYSELWGKKGKIKINVSLPLY